MDFHQKNIIALDLQNAILENLEAWFLETELITYNLAKDLIRQHIKDNITSENPIDYIFFINNIILGSYKKNDGSEIEYSDFLIDDLRLLQPISLTQLELYRSAIIDWIFNYNKENEIVFQGIQSLQEFEAEKYKFPDFTCCVGVIDTIDLGFKLKDFFLPLNQKFKAIHQFFRTQYQTNKILKNVNLSRVFLLDKLILGYSFQMEGSAEEHFFWNISLDERLLLMDKFTFNAPIKLTVDSILDKINLKGTDSLTEAEMNFLNNQKQL
ncbi:MAG: hypothetical protein ACI7YS_14050 [Flavobacterium sp.]